MSRSNVLQRQLVVENVRVCIVVGAMQIKLVPFHRGCTVSIVSYQYHQVRTQNRQGTKFEQVKKNSRFIYPSLLYMVHRNTVSSTKESDGSVLHRPFNDVGQMLPTVLARNVTNAGREVQHAALRERALDETGNVRVRVPDGLEAARDVDRVKEARDGLVQVRTDSRVGDRRDRRVRGRRVVEDGEGLAVARWCGRRRELEDGGAGERDAIVRSGDAFCLKRCRELT